MSYFAHSDELPEWAAQVPEGWASNWLKWSVDLSAKRPTEEEQDALPYISNDDIESWTGKLLVEEPKPTEADSRTFQENDVLFNKLRPYLAKVYHATFDGVSSGELLCFRPSHGVEPRFLFYVLVCKGFIDTINSETFGAKMPRADWEIVGHQPLPLPPLETQQRIVRFLDEKTARIDGLIGKKRAVLDRLAEKRQALIIRAVTKGLNPDAAMKPCGIRWLGKVPSHWDVLPLNRIVRMQAGDYISASDIETDGKNLVFGGNGVRGFAEDFNTMGPVVLVGRQGAHCGNVQVAHGEVWVSEHALRCFPEKDLVVQWLAYALEAMDLNQYSVSAAQPGLSVDNLKHLRIAFPPHDEQHSIADLLDARCGQFNEIVKETQESLSLFEEYRSALITAAVTGRLEELR